MLVTEQCSEVQVIYNLSEYYNRILCQNITKSQLTLSSFKWIVGHFTITANFDYVRQTTC